MVKYWIIDVDGTMTDAGIYYDEHGNELKKFCTKDAAGFLAAHAAGMKIIVLTGRECEATTRRMKELKVDYLFQNIKDKVSFLKVFITSHGIIKEELGYIGDDLNDYPSMKLTGYVACPSDSCKEIIRIADYVSPMKGGHGAVRDIIENYLEMHHLWDKAINGIYGIGI